MPTHSTRFVPSPEAFRVAREAGFLAAELQLSVELLLDWERVAQLAQGFSFEYALQFPNRLEVPAAAVENCAKLYRALECRTLVIHEPMFEGYVGPLLELDPSICLAVENNRFTPERFETWAQDNAFLALDIEHFWKFTLEDAPAEKLRTQLRQFLSTYGRKLRHVHLTGYAPGSDVHRPLYCNRDVVFAVLSLLSEANFNGCVVSEVSEQYQNRRELLMDTVLFDAWRDRDGMRTVAAVE